ncbi:MFS transporter [Tessaracoccus coleopterorum]|uniref:MFS transporter n=1 Tax=Tessaracoccus coleopterorum TaxID=2714950 RepID=UPI0018D43D6F|nr:MFS transporter [Tessaracoccus coleopterorum]
MLAWGGNHFTRCSTSTRPSVTTPLAGQPPPRDLRRRADPGLLLLAPISDRHGRRPAMLAGVVASLLASVLLAAGLASFPLLCLGRVLAGVGVGAAMSVGSSWVKELSSAPFDTAAGRTAGARRALLTLTAGFGIGAAVTGVLAQWGPAPSVTPYLVHGVLTLGSLAVLLTCPESLPVGRRNPGPWWRDLRVPSAGHRRFMRLVVPAAPGCSRRRPRPTRSCPRRCRAGWATGTPSMRRCSRWRRSARAPPSRTSCPPSTALSAGIP